jgi:SulP family sulfate permease
VKAGGVTRMVSFVHSVALLGSALFLGAVIGQIPLAALAGVLMVTAWRMNEWHLIRFYTARRLKSPTIVLVVTMIATVALDLTQAIIAGVVLSLLLFLSQVSRLTIVPTDVDWDRLRAAGYDVRRELPGIKVVYVSGALFFGAASQLVETVERLGACPALVLSLRGVPVLDASGLHALEHLWQHQIKAGGLLYLTGLQPPVERLLARAGVVAAIGADKFLWSADQAITAAAAHLAGGLACEWRPGRTLPPGDADPELDEMPLGVVPVD